MMSQQTYSATESKPILMTGHENKRYLLYIVSRGARTLADDIFSAMRRDMPVASVELIYDRRVGERRSQSGNVVQDRRSSDRRRKDPARQIEARGWARVELD